MYYICPALPNKKPPAVSGQGFFVVPKAPLDKTDIDNKLLPLIFNKKRNQSDNYKKSNGKGNK